MDTDLTTIRAELEQVRALSEKATTGEWWTNRALRPNEVYAGTGSGSDVCVARVFEPADARLAAAYRSLTPKLAGAMQKVLELHQPISVEEVVPTSCAQAACDHSSDIECPTVEAQVCVECLMDSEGVTAYVEWPCPTVQSVIDAMGGQDA